MRRILPVVLALLTACADSGPRDRSLASAARKIETVSSNPRVLDTQHESPPKPRFRNDTLVGLQTDELAPLYPPNADIIVRCADLATLQQQATHRLEQLAALLPDQRLPQLPPGTLLRVLCQLPEDLALDRFHPFALVETPEGWIVLLPIREMFVATERLRRVDPQYAISGSPAAVSAYRPSGRRGQYIGGDISVIARGDALRSLGERLAAAAKRMQINLPDLARVLGPRTSNLSRVDLSLHCREDGMQAELRIVPDHTNAEALATIIDSMGSSGGKALGLLRADATVQIASGCDVPSWLGLAEQLGYSLFEGTTVERATGLRNAITLLGDDAAFCWRMGPNEQPSLTLVAELTEPDRKLAREFLASEKILKLLRALGDTTDPLVYVPDSFERDGVPVAAVRGTWAADVGETLRRDRHLGEPFARMLADGQSIHIALVKNRLCMTMGADARKTMTGLLDRISGRKRARATPRARSNALRRKPLLEATFDAAVFLRSGNERATTGKRDRLPVKLAISKEGAALRLTARLPLTAMIAASEPSEPVPAAPPERD